MYVVQPFQRLLSGIEVFWSKDVDLRKLRFQFSNINELLIFRERLEAKACPSTAHAFLNWPLGREKDGEGVRMRARRWLNYHTKYK